MSLLSPNSTTRLFNLSVNDPRPTIKSLVGTSGLLSLMILNALIKNSIPYFFSNVLIVPITIFSELNRFVTF